MLKILFLSLIALLPLSYAMAEQNEVETHDLIADLNALSGANQISGQLTEYLADKVLASLHSDELVSDTITVHVHQEVDLLVDYELIERGGLAEIAGPFYRQHFSVSELQKLIQFYRSPIGMKSLHYMPLSHDAIRSMAIIDSEQRFKDIVPRIKASLVDAGLIKP